MIPSLPKLPVKPGKKLAELRAQQMSDSKKSPLTAGRRRMSARKAAFVKHTTVASRKS